MTYMEDGKMHYHFSCECRLVENRKRPYELKHFYISCGKHEFNDLVKLACEQEVLLQIKELYDNRNYDLCVKKITKIIDTKDGLIYPEQRFKAQIYKSYCLLGKEELNQALELSEKCIEKSRSLFEYLIDIAYLSTVDHCLNLYWSIYSLRISSRVVKAAV